MNSRNEIPSMLHNVYDYRRQVWDIKCTKDLEDLAIKSERELFFYLTYAYISDLDLSEILNQSSLILRLGVAVYVEQVKKLGFDDICNYLSKFMVIDESSTQAFKVVNEIKMAEEREKKINDGQLLG